MSAPKDQVRELPKPVDVQQALSEALTTLGPAFGDCALIGGVALAYHGVERYTKDVDLAVTQAQTATAEPAVQGRDPRPLRIGGISFATSTGVRVDLIDRRFEYRALFEEAIQAAVRDGLRVTVGGHRVPVVPLPHLVALKLAADRPQDEADLLLLLRREDLDYGIARDVVYRHMGHFAARRLDRAARAAQRKGAPADYENGDS